MHDRRDSADHTASTLPVLLLAVPAGALADSFDRRRMLIAVQCFQAATGACWPGSPWPAR